MKEKTIMIIIYMICYLSCVGGHWLISGFLYTSLNDVEWTRMEIYVFLMLVCTMFFIPLVSYELFRKEKPISMRE